MCVCSSLYMHRMQGGQILAGSCKKLPLRDFTLIVFRVTEDGGDLHSALLLLRVNPLPDCQICACQVGNWAGTYECNNIMRVEVSWQRGVPLTPRRDAPCVRCGIGGRGRRWEKTCHLGTALEQSSTPTRGTLGM